MKQYLMICDEIGMKSLQNVMKTECVQFLEVQGMGMGNGGAYNILVTPVLPPINQAITPTLEHNPQQEAPT